MKKIRIELDKKDLIKLIEMLGLVCTITYCQDTVDVMFLIEKIADQAKAQD